MRPATEFRTSDWKRKNLMHIYESVCTSQKTGLSPIGGLFGNKKVQKRDPSERSMEVFKGPIPSVGLNKQNKQGYSPGETILIGLFSSPFSLANRRAEKSTTKNTLCPNRIKRSHKPIHATSDRTENYHLNLFDVCYYIFTNSIDDARRPLCSENVWRFVYEVFNYVPFPFSSANPYNVTFERFSFVQKEIT